MRLLSAIAIGSMFAGAVAAATPRAQAPAVATPPSRSDAAKEVPMTPRTVAILLFDGVEATTHRWGIGDLQAAAPKCKVVTGKRFVDGGKIVTTAGIDGALHVVERLLGAEAAAWVAEEWMEHRPPSPAGR